MKERKRIRLGPVLTMSAVTGSGAGDVFDTLPWDAVILHCHVTILGTNVNFTVEGSPDGVNFGQLVTDAGTAIQSGFMNSAPSRRSVRIPGPIPRYMRVAYAVSGTATTATVSVELSKSGLP